MAGAQHPRTNLKVVPLNRETLQDRVYRKVCDLILDGEIAPGQLVTIQSLADAFEVSHMPVREALRVLHGEGLVVIEPNRGAWVRPLHPNFIEDLFDVRLAMEAMLARRAAERRTEQHLQRLREAEARLEAFVAAGDVQSVPLANREFHAIINDAAGNPGALAVVERHWLLLVALLQRLGHPDERFQRVIDDHQHLIYALENGDAVAAATLMAAHIEKGKQNLIRRAAAAEIVGMARSA